VLIEKLDAAPAAIDANASRHDPGMTMGHPNHAAIWRSYHGETEEGATRLPERYSCRQLFANAAIAASMNLSSIGLFRW
jgi:hypothetical protein